LSLDEAAERARITPPRQKKGDVQRLSPADRLRAWESGVEPPSLPQLEAVATAYRRPLLTFFLPSPPTKHTSLADFRTVGSVPTRVDTPEFAAFKRRLEALHGELIELLSMEGQQPLSFVGSVANTMPPSQLVQSIRSTLSFHFKEQQSLRDGDQFLKVLREKAQSVGIFVLFEGDLGSYHSKIMPDEFRGIAFADRIAPLIVVNPNDARAARLFTFVHEIAHIWIGASGVSNLDALGNPGTTYANRNNERLCNMVAAEFLVPESLLSSAWAQASDGETVKRVEELSRTFKVSREVIARRLFDQRHISEIDYRSLIAIYRAAWQQNVQRQKETDSGPNKNIMDKFRLGDRLLRIVTCAAFDGKITMQSAARILRVPASRFDKVLYATRS